MRDDSTSDHSPDILQPVQPANSAQVDLSTYCPQCGSQLCESRCKLVCMTCGFFSELQRLLLTDFELMLAYVVVCRWSSHNTDSSHWRIANLRIR